jgi:predicted N-acetyltransferase YhbS
MICIRKAEKADYPVVMDLIERTIRDVHGSGHLSLAEMRDSEYFVPELSLVAEFEGHKIVGHIYLIRVTINHTHPSLGLAQIIVSPEYQGLSIGSMMVEKAHQKAKELGYGSVVSLGCKRFLSKFGYHTVADFGIHFPYGVVEDQCLIVELIPGALDKVHGMVGFPLEYM